MQKVFLVELFFFILCLLFKKSESIKCYVCRSDVNSFCEGTVNDTYLKNCSANSSYCRKISQKLRFKNENFWTSVRECAFEKGHMSCYYYRWVEYAHQETCECDKDGCNSGRCRTANILTVASIFTLARMYNYLETLYT